MAEPSMDALWTVAEPMLASGPPDPVAPMRGPGWTHEVKWDGIRALARVRAGGEIHLRSRRRVDLATRYPGIIAGAGLGLGEATGEAILDGECVWFDDAGRTVFRGLRAGSAARFVVFDVLAWRGVDLRDRQLRERVDLLDGLDLPALTDRRWLGSARFDDGQTLFEVTREQGHEGVMAKRLDSPYRCGVRAAEWVKLPHRALTDVVVVGWVRSEFGSGASSLIVAGPEGWVLGTVGSGLTAETSATLAAVLGGLGRPAPADPVQVAPEIRLWLRRFGARLAWSEPVLVAEVRHLGWTEHGQLRQPVLHRMRPDLAPEDLAGSAW